jgi:ABC-type uncharacterized transport system ATPase subunit
MGATSAIIASGLFKSFGTLAVLRGVDLDVPAGTVFALLGPNGAGKTTIVRILTTLSRPDSGTARVAGFDITTEAHDLRRAISLTGQSVAIDELQTGKETLYMMEGTPAALKDRVGTERLRITFASPGDCDDSLRVLRTKHPVVDTARHSVEVDSDGTAAGARALLDAIDPDRSKVIRFELRRPTLDDVFLAYTTKGGKSSDRRRP